MKIKYILEKLVNFSGTIYEFMEEIGEIRVDMYRRYRDHNYKPKNYKRGKSKNEFVIERENQRLSNYINKLSKQGFIKKTNKFIKITELGKEKLEKLSKIIPLPKNKYIKKPSDETTIFVFDIPEKMSYFRKWLRMNLVTLDFKILQKSVWIGKVELPENFIKDIHNLNLEEYIHIFKVTKGGTL